MLILSNISTVYVNDDFNIVRNRYKRTNYRTKNILTVRMISYTIKMSERKHVSVGSACFCIIKQYAQWCDEKWVQRGRSITGKSSNMYASILNEVLQTFSGFNNSFSSNCKQENAFFINFQKAKKTCLKYSMSDK